MVAAVILTLLAQQYPIEAPPRQPVIAVPFMGLMVAAPTLDLAADASQPMRVLIVFDPTVATTQAQANQWCQDRINSANQVDANDPGMPGRWQLAGCFIATHYTPKGGVQADLSWITSDATVRAWRDAVRADFVTFDSRYGDWCGQAWQCAAQTGAQFAFSAVSHGCAIGNLSLAHEMGGHNRCAAHDLPNQTPSFPYGSGFCAPDGSRSVMSYPGSQLSPNPCTGSRLPYFSNPRIVVHGVAFGSTTQFDNARVVEEQWAKTTLFQPPMTLINH